MKSESDNPEGHALNNIGDTSKILFFFFLSKTFLYCLFCFCFFLIYFIYLFLAALGLCCCVRAFSSCGERGLLFVEVRWPLIAVASPVAEHGL